MTKPVKTMLVKAPDGFGYHLNHQKPRVYVSGRPHVVQNDSQVQMASARNALIILGETEVTDEEFLEAYREDADAAIKDAIVKNEKADEAAAESAAESAAKAKEEAAKIAQEEEARLKAEAEAKAKAEAEHADRQKETSKAKASRKGVKE